MAIITVSSKFKEIIPEDIWRRAGIKMGQKVVVIEKDGIINIIPKEPIGEMRGFLKGMRIENIRDEGERF